MPPEHSEEQPDTPSETIPAIPLTPAQPSEQPQEVFPMLEPQAPSMMLTSRARNEVYTSITGGNHAHTGDGSYANPYNLFDDAVRKTPMPGGTIIIKNKAFLNTLNEPEACLISLTRILPSSPRTRTIRQCFRFVPAVSCSAVMSPSKYVNLNFENKVHDVIFANGHTLTLKNVLRANGSRRSGLVWRSAL